MRRVVIVSVLLLVVVAGTAGLIRDDEPTLSVGLRQTMQFVDSTAAAVAPGHTSYPETDYNADINQIDELSNNHSFADHSNQARYPGFNDCDSWQNIIDNGWSAHYSVTVYLHDERDGKMMLDTVREEWAKQGLEIEEQTTRTSGGTLTHSQLVTDIGISDVQFSLDWPQRTARISGTTDCLRP